MDPLSFTASLVTVAALAATSSKKIYDLRKRFSSAPKDVETLLEQLQTFESLLKELEAQLQDHRNSASPHGTLQQVWGNSITQMQRDMQSLQTVLSKVEPLLKKKSKTSRILLLARQTFSEKEVEQYRSNIDTHCGTLTSIQAMVCSQKLDKLSKSAVQRGDEDRAALQTVSSHLSQSTIQLGTEFKSGLSTVTSQLTGTESASGVRHQTVVAHLTDLARSDSHNTEKLDEVSRQQVRSIDIIERGFQAVQSSLITSSSSDSEEHRTTHAMLSQCQSHLQRLVRKHLTFGVAEDSIHLPSTRPKTLNPNTTETVVFWNYLSLRLPVGTLRIRLNQTRKTNNSRRSAGQVCAKSEIAVKFVPPPWLSSFAINYSMELSRNLINSHWRWGATLKPLTVNYNRFFINAVRSLDVEGVRTSFATGLASPTDYLANDDAYENGLIKPWYELLKLDGSPRCACALMFDYMVKNGLPGLGHVMRTVLMDRPRDYDEQDFLRNYLHSYMKHGGDLKDTRSLIFFGSTFAHRGRIDWISESLITSSEPWLVDDFSSLDICLIGALAQVDAVFRGRLKKKLFSYRSPVSVNGVASIDHLFETTFGTASIESHFHTLDERLMYEVSSLVSRTGSTSLMKLFIDMGIDVNGTHWRDNLLGCAAAGGNTDNICMLLEAGANSSLAVTLFLGSSHDLSDASFRLILEMLVNNAEPASFNPGNDPLLAVFMSSRARKLCPKAPEMLLNRNIFTDTGFGRRVDRANLCRYYYNYMFEAISNRNPFAVNFLLQNGAHADARISELFHCQRHWFESCTWMTFAVMHGAVSCIDVLIQHGADVAALDGAGRSAVQLAKINASASHPRPIFHKWMGNVSAEEDAETLAVVERAFKLKFQGRRSLEEHLKLSDSHTLRPSPRPKKSVSVLRNTFGKALELVLTPAQTETLHDHLRKLYWDMRKIWSLPFYEALLVRFIYVLSYALLLAVEMNAFIKGHKRIPMPSRSLLSAAALLLLAIVWGSSQTGMTWGSITGQSKSETDI